MANLADAVLRTLQLGSGGAEETQARVMNNQQMQENHRIQQAQADRDWMAKISNTELFNDLKFGKQGEAPYSFDILSAYNKDPQLALGIFDGYSRSLFNAKDEKGRPIQVKPVAILPANIEGQEMFAVEVERPDGKRAPLTRGGTPAGDDNVILMSRDDLNGLASQRLGTMANNGAMSAVPTVARLWQDIPDAAARDNAAKDQAIRDEVDAMFDDDEIEPEARREVFALFSSLDGPELEEAARDMGIDVDAIVSALQANAEAAAAAPGAATTEQAVAEETQQGTSLANGIRNATMGLPGATAAVDAAALTGQVAGDVAKDPVGFSERLHQSVFGENSNRIRQDMTIAEKTGRQPNQVVATPEQRAAGAEFFGGLVQKAQASPVFKAAADYVSGAVAPDSTKSSVTPDLAAAPQPVQQAILDTELSPEDRRSAILGAIEQGLQAPTEQQRTAARDFMINQKIQSPQDLSALPGPEVMNLAWVLASADPNLTVTERMKVAQGVINFAQFGDPETSARDVANDQFNRTKFAIEQQSDYETRMLRAAELERTLGADNTKAIEARRELAAEANTYVTEVRKGIPRAKDGRIKDRPTPEADIALGQITMAYETAVRIGDEEAQFMYARALDEAIADYVAAFVIAEPASFWDQFGVAGVSTENLMNLLSRKSFRSLKADFGDFIIERNDRVSDEYPNGEPTKLALVTPSGQKAERGVINLSRLRDRLGEPEFTYFMEMLERQEAANASKRSK